MLPKNHFTSADSLGSTTASPPDVSAENPFSNLKSKTFSLIFKRIRSEIRLEALVSPEIKD